MFLITHALDEAAMLADRIGVMSARPGRLIDVVETNWPRERDSRIVERPEFGARHGAAVEVAARGIAEDHRARGDMTRVTLYRVLVIVVAAVAGAGGAVPAPA